MISDTRQLALPVDGSAGEAEAPAGRPALPHAQQLSRAMCEERALQYLCQQYFNFYLFLSFRAAVGRIKKRLRVEAVIFRGERSDAIRKEFGRQWVQNQQWYKTWCSSPGTSSGCVCLWSLLTVVLTPLFFMKPAALPWARGSLSVPRWYHQPWFPTNGIHKTARSMSAFRDRNSKQTPVISPS